MQAILFEQLANIQKNNELPYAENFIPIPFQSLGSFLAASYFYSATIQMQFCLQFVDFLERSISFATVRFLSLVYPELFVIKTRLSFLFTEQGV